jgi:selenoprotein W-related protein
LPQVDVRLIPSGGGVFEVVADGATIHSKKKTGQFPEPADIVSALRSRLQ